MTSYQQSDDQLTREENEFSSGGVKLGAVGWARWFWRQLTSMRTALILLLLLAVAAVPGSVYPQRSADPNGVRLQFDENPDQAAFLDSLQLFDVYTSVWFSAIYILLFVSLIGCVVPRTQVHYRAMRSQPVKTPVNLTRMSAHQQVANPGVGTEDARQVLRQLGYRANVEGNAVSAEKGFIRETGNLIFHYSLIGLLIAVGVGGGLSYSGQRVLVEGDSFVNNLASYDSFSPGTFFEPQGLEPFTLTLDNFDVIYDLRNQANIGNPIEFRAEVTTRTETEAVSQLLRVNHPLAVPGGNIYLTGNGFAPVITVRDGQGNISFSGPVPYLPQDGNMTSLGVIKAPDSFPEQIGFISFFYPTVDLLPSGAYTSIYPDPIDPLLTMNVYVGDLGLDSGIPRNVYALDVTNMTEVAGRNADTAGLELTVGEQVSIPGGYGTVSFDGLKRYISVDIAQNPGGTWILLFSLIALAGVTVSLMVPRRRVWVRFDNEKIEVAALARGDDPRLESVVSEVIEKLKGSK